MWTFLERNLNPKAACLKRREEEKAEDGPKIPQHHLLQQAPYPALPVSENTPHLDSSDTRLLHDLKSLVQSLQGPPPNLPHNPQQ